jgi:hypothetical protein
MMKITHAEVILTKISVHRPHKMAIGTTVRLPEAFYRRRVSRVGGGTTYGWPLHRR